MAAAEKANVLQVITKLELGGAQKYVLNLLAGLDRGKFNLFLFTSHEGMLVEQAAQIPGLTFKRSRFLDRPVNPFKDFLAFFSLYFYIKKNNIDIVHTHSSKAGIIGRLAARAAGVKVIVHCVHGWSFHDAQSKFFYRVCVGLERWCARFTDTIIVVARQDELKGRQHGIVPRGNYVLARYGFPRLEYGGGRGRSEAKLALGLGGSDRVVGMVACLKPQKAPQDFVRLAVALKEVLPDLKFALVGDGPLRKETELLIKKAGLEKDVMLAGWRRNIPFILSAFDVCVLTSRWEGLPVSVMEAMAAGVPVVVTDTGGIRELVLSGETGYLVKVGDITDMRDKVAALLKDSGLRTSVSGRAAQFIRNEEFSLNQMIKKTEAVYHV